MTTQITVQTNHAAGAKYDDADGWTVDDRGDLHIIKKEGGTKTIATHAHGHWISVARVQSSAGPLAAGTSAHVRGAW